MRVRENLYEALYSRYAGDVRQSIEDSYGLGLHVEFGLLPTWDPPSNFPFLQMARIHPSANSWQLLYEVLQTHYIPRRFNLLNVAIRQHTYSF